MWKCKCLSLSLSETEYSSLLWAPQYDPNTGAMTEWYTPAGARELDESVGYIQHNITMDGTRPRVRRITAAGTGTLFDTGDYTYDGAGNVETIAGSAQTPGWTYSYDKLSRLVSATRGGKTRTYVLDGFSNLVSMNGMAIGVDVVNNRLTAGSYDTRGNLTHEPTAYGWTRRMRYDPHNRLMATWATGAGAPEDVHVASYDQTGERVLKYRVDQSQPSPQLMEVTFYVRDEAGNVLSEMQWGVEGLESTTRDWYRVNDYVYSGREPLVRLETELNDPGNPADDQRYYVTLVTDHLGSVRAEAPTTTPTQARKMDYWPYGELVQVPAGLDEKHLFTSHERELDMHPPSIWPIRPEPDLPPGTCPGCCASEDGLTATHRRHACDDQRRRHS